MVYASLSAGIEGEKWCPQWDVGNLHAVRDGTNDVVVLIVEGPISVVYGEGVSQIGQSCYIRTMSFA